MNAHCKKHDELEPYDNTGLWICPKCSEEANRRLLKRLPNGMKPLDAALKAIEERINETNRYRVKIMLKNGKMFRTTIECTEEEFEEVFSLPLKLWNGEGTGGHIVIDYTYISLAEIVHFRVKELRFYFF